MSTETILKSIGYPEPDLPESIEPVESATLYDHARKNKIGSLYVKSLDESSQINKLTKQWKNREDFQERTKQTLNRFPETIPSHIEYAVVKSGYPWVDSKDIDLVLFEDNLEEFEDYLLNEGYEFCGRSPTSFDVIDPVTNIQLDIQSGFSLQRVIYFDKRTVQDGVERRAPYGTAVPILEKPDDLALIVIHSITEQMYILKEFYTAVAMLESFSRNQFERFLNIVAENNIESACRSFFTITWELCRQVFDRIPPYLRETLNRVGLSKQEQMTFRSSNLKTPHKYTSATGVRTIAEKMRNSLFRRSLASQVPRLVHPATAYYIFSQIVTRREREHYVHDTSDMGEA
ncbi:hypothetical protein [Halogeometricum pallidum]|uniref:hypothetical protein n=1 Tax=Halogeometricum pallidum TaxID=411361 RepID=UPI0012691DA1|nr:hypothetical protein [Halogeometricum pallidum]